MKLVVIGGTVVDCIFPGLSRLPRWPRHTEFTPANLVFAPAPPIVTLGGNGANAAFVAARCGVRVVLQTRIGRDPLGRMARTWLEEAGVEVRAPKDDYATAVNVTSANRRHQRATLFYPGPGAGLRPRSSQGPGWMLICGWPHPSIGDMSRAMQSYRRRAGMTAFDPGPLLGQRWSLAVLRPVLRLVDLLLVNEHELKRLSGSRRLEPALRRLRREYPGHVVVKRGAAGVLWLAPGDREPQCFPGRRVSVRNTVGAGDSFNGGLLAALTRGTSFPSALNTAARVAASVVASDCGVLGARPLGML